MSLYLRNKIWWSKLKVGGETMRQSCRTGIRGDAERYEQELKKKYKANLQYTERGKVGINDLGGLDIARAKRGGQTAEHMRHGVIHHWKKLCEFFQDKHGEFRDPATLTEHDITDYIDHRIAMGVRPQTYKREVQALKRGLALGSRRYHYAMPIPDEAWPEIENTTKDEQRRGKLWPIETIWQWLDLLTPEARDQNIFIMHTAVRIEEAERIQPGMIVRTDNPDMPGILMLPDWATKTKVARQIGLLPEAMAAVTRQLARRKGKVIERGTLFSGTNFRKQMASASRKLGLPFGITPRDLRHSFLSTSLKEGADLKALMEMAGHSTIAAAELYQSSTLQRTTESVMAYARAKSVNRPIRAQGVVTSPVDNEKDVA